MTVFVVVIVSALLYAKSLLMDIDKMHGSTLFKKEDMEK